jgi:uncharacterized protein (TIGR02001 family)
MLTRRLISLCLVGLLAAASARAQVTSTVTATSDYDFRGVSLSATDPAVQASVDLASGGGFAAGVWASTVDFGDAADVEIDLSLGYAGAVTDQLAWSAGLVAYFWPDSEVVGNYPEAYVGLVAGPLALKQWFTHDYGDLGEAAWYTEANLTWSLTDHVSLLAHGGYSYGDYWTRFGGGNLFDYSLGVGLALRRFTLTAKYTGTTADGSQRVRSAIFNNEGRFIVSLATTFPWRAAGRP